MTFTSPPSKLYFPTPAPWHEEKRTTILQLNAGNPQRDRNDAVNVQSLHVLPRGHVITHMLRVIWKHRRRLGVIDSCEFRLLRQVHHIAIRGTRLKSTDIHEGATPLARQEAPHAVELLHQLPLGADSHDEAVLPHVQDLVGTLPQKNPAPIPGDSLAPHLSLTELN